MDPELTGQALETWDFFEKHIQSEMDAELELYRENRSKVNSGRAQNGLPPI